MVTHTEDETAVYFGVFSFGQDPQVVTTLMRREPTRTWRKGDPYGDRGGIRTHSRWELRSPAQTPAPLEEQLDSLLSLLEESPEEVRAVASRFEAGICCAVKYWVSFNPSIHLSSAAIARASALGLSIDFDLYLFSQEQCNSESAA